MKSPGKRNTAIVEFIRANLENIKIEKLTEKQLVNKLLMIQDITKAPKISGE